MGSSSSVEDNEQLKLEEAKEAGNRANQRRE